MSIRKTFAGQNYCEDASHLVQSRLKQFQTETSDIRKLILDQQRINLENLLNILKKFNTRIETMIGILTALEEEVERKEASRAQAKAHPNFSFKLQTRFNRRPSFESNNSIGLDTIPIQSNISIRATFSNDSFLNGWNSTNSSSSMEQLNSVESLMSRSNSQSNSSMSLAKVRSYPSGLSTIKSNLGSTVSQSNSNLNRASHSDDVNDGYSADDESNDDDDDDGDDSANRSDASNDDD